MQKQRIFVASPADIATERAKVETVAALFKPLADHLDIVLEVVDWRSVVPDMGRPEQVILNQLQPTSWDVFIGILWHSFGTPPDSQDPQTQKAYLGGTEEEFKTAYRLWKESGKPRLMIYRCMRAIPPDALNPDQFKRVKEFFAQFDALKGEHPGLYQSFETTDEFEKLLLNSLQKLLLAYGEELKGVPITPQVVQTFAPKIPNNMPRRALFFGRTKEMGIVLRALSPEDRTWGVLVDGIGGIGKTALAVEAAYRCQEQGLFDVFIFVSAKQTILAPSGIREQTSAVRTLDECLNETTRVLGQPDIARLAGDGKRRALLDSLRSTRALLIYDNLETLTKEEQEALTDFLRELPQGCKSIITSRRRGGDGAVWLRLEKLEWEAARAIINREMARDAQLANKLRRAGEARWHELYDETGGSPLALAHTLGLMRVRMGMTFDGVLAMLRGSGDTDLQRFIFQEARQELTTNDQTALGALAFFVPSSTVEAWMEVGELSRNALETTIDHLNTLSLVDVLVVEERYALHALTRHFVRDELLADEQITNATGMRFAEYWVAYATRYGGEIENYKTFNLLEAEWANLDAAATWLWQIAAVQGEEVDDRDAASRLNDLASALRNFLLSSGRWDERVQLSTRAYEAMRVLNAWSAAGWCAQEVAWIHYNRANTDEAAHWADICMEAWSHGGSRREQATGMRLRGLVAEQHKDYDTTEQLYQGVLTICRDLQFDEDVANVLADLGRVEAARKQYDTAERYYSEALALTRIDDKEGQAGHSANLGELALERERWVEAREWYEKALRLAREVARQDLIADAQVSLARVHEAEGRPDLALPLAQEAMATYERLRDRYEAGARKLVERLMQAAGGQ
jgi:tetratricopeptide (TPR) repeat protein